MQANPALVCAKFEPFGHFGLAVDLVAKRPSLSLVLKRDFLDAVNLSVLDLKPGYLPSHGQLLAIAILKADLFELE